MPEPLVLRLPPAPHGRRAAAVAVDLTLTALLAVAVSFTMAVITRSPQPIGPTAALVVLFLSAMLIHVVAPLRWEATPGMRAAGLKIVAEEDLSPLPAQTGLRGVVASVTAATLIPAVFQIASVLADPDHRSNSDWISGTRVVLDPERETA